MSYRAFNARSFREKSPKNSISHAFSPMPVDIRINIRARPDTVFNRDRSNRHACFVRGNRTGITLNRHAAGWRHRLRGNGRRGQMRSAIAFRRYDRGYDCDWCGSNHGRRRDNDRSRNDGRCRNHWPRRDYDRSRSNNARCHDPRSRSRDHGRGSGNNFSDRFNRSFDNAGCRRDGKRHQRGCRRCQVREDAGTFDCDRLLSMDCRERHKSEDGEDDFFHILVAFPVSFVFFGRRTLFRVWPAFLQINIRHSVCHDLSYQNGLNSLFRPLFLRAEPYPFFSSYLGDSSAFHLAAIRHRIQLSVQRNRGYGRYGSIMRVCFIEKPFVGLTVMVRRKNMPHNMRHGVRHGMSYQIVFCFFPVIVEKTGVKASCLRAR